MNYSTFIVTQSNSETVEDINIPETQIYDNILKRMSKMSA